MLKILSVVGLMCVPGLALAKDVKLPEDNAVITAALPDTWTSKQIDDGYETTSEDGSTYLTLQVKDLKDDHDYDVIINETKSFLKDQGVSLDSKSAYNKSGNINDMKYLQLVANGQDKDGPLKINLFILDTGRKKAAVLFYWGTAVSAEKYGVAVDSSLNSIKLAK